MRRRNVHFSGDLGLLREETIQGLLKEDLFHFGFGSDLPPSLQYLHSGDMPAVSRWLVWAARRERAVSTAA
ncbi:MAG: hypothetical protein HY587_06415 [Candidatus Omnitrophica bacterium]|nr:hypothetical protein [Candidatus Omnitrophota bacterium]